MSLRSSPLPHNSRFSSEAFEPLNRGDATIDIPLEPIRNGGLDSSSTLQPSSYVTGNTMGEKERPVSTGGVRRVMALERTKGYDGEEDTINRMGKFYDKLLRSSIIVRYFIYIIPLGALFAIPMIIGATVAQGATIGDVRIVWLFAWLLIVWVGLWTSKLVAHYLPNVFQFLCGIVSSETRKYALMLRHLEIQLSLAGAALVALSTFKAMMQRNPDTRAANAAKKAAGGIVTYPEWETVVDRILAAAMVSTLIWLGERFFIQLISVNYHRKQFSLRIRESKGQIRLLALMYDASRAMFPAFCHEFAEEDAIISDTLDVTFAKKKFKKGHFRSGSTTPLRLLRDVGRIGNKVTSAFGNVAHEITGKDVFNPTSAQSIVVEALERNRSSEALAKRLWLSFVIEGHDALYIDDVNEVLGSDRHAEADAAFAMLDLDGNGDVTMDEMIMMIAEMGRERKAIANSMHDVDQAINVLDHMLCVVVFVVVIFTFIAFLNTSFVTTLATAGTALLSLSFVFSVTCQEILGSCIFLFVKHPFDIGDRVDLTMGNDQLVVEHVSLLFTVFRRITNNRTLQIPNNVLNTLWIENVSRSKAMREVITVPIHFDTTLEDIQLLRTELNKFVQDKDNSRDFYADVEIEVQSVGSLDKLELTVHAQHKSNWGNETLRAARRSKFMCALVLAVRKVPIYGSGAGGAALGEIGNPHYQVMITDTAASDAKADFENTKEGKRMVPSSSAPADPPTSPTLDKKPPSSDAQPTNTLNTTTTEPKTLSPITESASETLALNTLNERSPAFDTARDDGTDRVEGVQTIGHDRRGIETRDVEEMRGILKRATTVGRRKRGDSLSQHLSPQGQGVPLGASGSVGLSHTQSQGLTTAYNAAPSIPPIAVNTNGIGIFGLGRETSLRRQTQTTQPTSPRSPLRQQNFPPPGTMQHAHPAYNQGQQPQFPQQENYTSHRQFPSQTPSRSTSPASQRSYEGQPPRPGAQSTGMGRYAPLESQDYSGEGFRGDYEDENPEQGAPVKGRAGTEYSAGIWKGGV